MLSTALVASTFTLLFVLFANLRERLAAYKVPKVIVFVESLPKSNVGKIIRKDLR